MQFLHCVCMPLVLLCLLQLKNISVPVYERVREITKNHNEHFFTFNNEFCKYVNFVQCTHYFVGFPVRLQYTKIVANIHVT